MNYEKMQAETDVRAEKEQQELSAHSRLSEFVKEIDSSLFRDELRVFFLLLSEPDF